MAKTMGNIHLLNNLTLMTDILDEISMPSHMCAVTLYNFTKSQQTYNPQLEQYKVLGMALVTQGECFTFDQMQNFQWHTIQK
jgi:hypothetical protein